MFRDSIFLKNKNECFMTALLVIQRSVPRSKQKVYYFHVNSGLPQTLCVKEKDSRSRGGQPGQPSRGVLYMCVFASSSLYFRCQTYVHMKN